MMIHPNWLRDRKLPYDSLHCPVCSRVRTHRVTAWWWDEEMETYRCRGGECGERYETMLYRSGGVR